MNHWLVVGLGIVLALGTPAGLAAGYEKDTATVPTMETVVVSAGRVDEPKKELTVHVSVIDAETIKQSSARTVADILSEQGFAVRKYPGSLASIGIRAFQTETHGNDLEGHVLILINGRRAGTGNLAKLLTQNIERIEVIRGPASAQYGSAAVGGLVNVITKQGQGKPAAFAESFLGSWDFEEYTAGFSGRHRRLDFSGTYTRQSQNDYETGDNQKYFNTGFDHKDNISLNLGWNFLDHHRLGIVYNHFDVEKQGSPGYLSQNDQDDYTDKSNSCIDLIYDGRTTSNVYDWKVRYFTGEDEDKWVDPIESDPNIFWDDGIPSKMTTDNQGAQAQLTAHWPLMRLTGGVDWVNYDIEATWTPQETSYTNTAGFFLAKKKLLNDRLILSGGLRYDHYEVEVEAPAGNTEDDSNMSFSAGTAFFLRADLKLRLNYAEAFVMPAADQLAADFVSFGTHYVGNPDLDPEKSRTYEAGIDFSRRALYASLTYFYTDFEDKIESVTLSNGDQSWDNLDDATVSGIEGEFNFDMGALLNWNYEVRPYVRFTFLTQYEDGATGEDLHYTPDWTAAWGVNVSDGDDFTANLNFAYTGDQTVIDYESGWPYNVVQLESYTVANLTLGKGLAASEKYGRVALKAEIENLFDQDYAPVKGYPMPGRSFFVGLRYDY